MPKPKAGGESSKKAQGQARKAEAAANKQAEKNKQAQAVEDAKWEQGSKSNAKGEAAKEKAAEAARKKAERDAMLAAEEASQPSKPKGAGTKKAEKKSAAPSRGLDAALSSFDAPAGSKKAATISATGIDNALDALSLDGKSNDQIDRHPERRFAAAYKAFEERRLEEMKDEKGLRRQQKIDQIRKEFDKHPDNPFNQVSGKFNSTRDELREIADQEKKKTEARLVGR